MSGQIWKYPLKIQDEQQIEMPKGAKPLCVHMQHSELCLWCLVKLSGQTEQRRIFIHGTGHQVYATEHEYIGTVHMMGGNLVWHVFDGGPV